MSAGSVYSEGQDLFCQLGELPDDEAAPFVPLYHADDFNQDLVYGCDESIAALLSRRKVLANILILP